MSFPACTKCGHPHAKHFYATGCIVPDCGCPLYGTNMNSEAAYADTIAMKEESTMSDIQVTQEMLDQAMSLIQQEKAAAAQASQTPSEPKVPLAVRMAVGLANAVTGTENVARNAKEGAKGFVAAFKAAYVANRPVVTSTMPKDVSPEELAAAIAKIQQSQ